MPGTMDSKSWIEASESKNHTNNIVQIRVINDSPPLPHTNLFVITLNHENHFYTSPDAPGLLIKFIWAHTDHANKTFQGPGEE